MHRVLIPIDSQDPESWQYALAYAQKIGEQQNNPTDIVLLVHTKRQIDGTSLTGHMGRQQAKALSGGKSLQLQSGARLNLKTLNTMGQMLNNAIIIAFFADAKMLDAVDSLRGVVGVVAVPDLPGDADQWVARWGAIVHGAERQPAKRLIDDQIVENALSRLFSMVNPTTGIGHPRDKQMADETLRILRAKGHTLNPETIRSRAIQQGWRADQASELGKLAEKIKSLKSKPKLSGIHNWEGRYQSWSE
ncbi:MAG: DUF1889 family protein [Thermomicrobiales bacterium]